MTGWPAADTAPVPEDPEATDPAAPGPRRTRRIPGAAWLVALLVVVVALGAVGLITRPGTRGSGSGPADTATPSSTASAVSPPAAEVRPVHGALHDLDARCKPGASSKVQIGLARDADRIVAFARRYPNARFPIDDETGSTLSLLLVARQSLRTCAPAAAATVDGALPPQYRDRPATPQ